MKNAAFVLLALLICVSPRLVGAYTAVVEPVSLQYEVVTVGESPAVMRSILGELEGSPEMFEITSDVEFMLTVEIRAIADAGVVPELGGIIIRQKEPRGVEEVARLQSTDADWLPVVDKKTGLPYLAGPFWSESVPAGTYRIEVSTPENAGRYILVIGSEPDTNGYAENVRNVAETYRFYGVSTLRMFNSPYIHYPLGSVVLLILIGGTWWWQRKRTRHV